MAASATDKFTKTGAATKTSLSSPGKALAASSINVGATTNWPTDTGVVFAIREVELVDGEYQEVAGTYTEWVGTVSGTTINNLTLAYGSDQVYAAGATTEVFIPISSYAHNRFVDGLLVGHLQTGLHKPFTESAIVPTAALQDEAVTTPKLDDDSVTAAKVDWASTGANGGIWWEELGRTTLGSAGDTISVASLPARKYLQIRFSGTGSGAINQTIRFNNDSGSNYYQNIAVNGGAGAGTGSAAQITLSSGDSNSSYQTILEVTNIAATEKFVIGNSVLSAAGASVVATMVQATAKWVNTSTQISRIDFINTGAGDFAIGSEVVVLGHN